MQVTRAGNAGYEHLLLAAGKLGYVARSIVWLLIAWLFVKAALHTNSAEAGDTGKPFAFLQTLRMVSISLQRSVQVSSATVFSISSGRSTKACRVVNQRSAAGLCSGTGTAGSASPLPSSER